MRLLIISTLLALVPVLAQAQATPTPNRLDGSGVAVPTNPGARPTNPRNHGETEVNILLSYYQQDGNRGAVEGGIGTQYLTDLTPTIILNVPLDSATRVSANLGMDYYASASTDRIDQVLSSPSAHDARIHADVGIARQLADKRTVVGLGAGVSKEYDYLSGNVSASWAHASADGNRELSLSGQVFFDKVTLIGPAELRPGGPDNRKYGSDTRQSFNLSIVYAQVLTKRLQVALSTELVAQRGLLATPFHRVYFFDSNPLLGAPGQLGTARVENLPRLRYKFPVGLRLTYFATDLVQLRGYYRFYNDDFNISAHTFELETPVKVTPFFVLYPFYRYHTQTAATYFAAYKEHSVADTYYTSDYDLAAFSAQKAGLGLRYSPVYGIGRFQGFGHRLVKFKALDFRYAYYQQSTGLTANLFSVDLSFVMP